MNCRGADTYRHSSHVTFVDREGCVLRIAGPNNGTAEFEELVSERVGPKSELREEPEDELRVSASVKPILPSTIP